MDLQPVSHRGLPSSWVIERMPDATTRITFRSHLHWTVSCTIAFLWLATALALVYPSMVRREPGPSLMPALLRISLIWLLLGLITHGLIALMSLIAVHPKEWRIGPNRLTVVETLRGRERVESLCDGTLILYKGRLQILDEQTEDPLSRLRVYAGGQTLQLLASPRFKEVEAAGRLIAEATGWPIQRV